MTDLPSLWPVFLDWRDANGGHPTVARLGDLWLTRGKANSQRGRHPHLQQLASVPYGGVTIVPKHDERERNAA